MLSLRQPHFLLLLPLVLLVILAGRGLAGRHASAQRRAVVLTLRSTALALLIVAIAQPIVPTTVPQLPDAFIVDTSTSISSSARNEEMTWLKVALQAASNEAKPRIVTFAAQPTLWGDPPSSIGDWLQQRLVTDPHDGATDIASAVRLGIGAAPDGAQVVLLSDGLQTTGDAQAAAAVAAARHITISTVLLPGSGTADAAVTRLVLLGTAHAGDTLPLQVTIWSNRSTNATLQVLQDGRSIGQQAVQLRPGESPLLVNIPSPSPGWHSFRASILMAGDAVAQNNALDVTTLVTAPPRLLVVTQDPAGSAISPLLRALGFQVRSASPGQFPRTLSALQAYDAVLLDDLPAPALAAQQVKALDLAVRTQGIGLFVLGGPQSLTLGHYSLTPLERMLPVLSETPSSLQQGNVALQLVLDRSGSMNDLAGGNVPKIVTSQAAAAIALDFVVQHKDQLGIVSFDFYPHLLYPLQPTTAKDTNRVRRIIAGMSADGGTDIYHALLLGLKQVIASSAPYKHIILMTDGRSEPANYSNLITQMQRAHVTLSAVGLGADADLDLLRYLATKGKGRFYYTNNGADLPHIFAEEARLSAGSARVVGAIPVALGSSSPVTRSLGTIVLPPIHGYMATVLKREAQAGLLTRASGYSGDPVLAQWQYGLGRVLVWTPGVSNWAASWITGQQNLWNDAIRWILHGTSLAALTPHVLPGDSPHRVVIDTQQNVGTLLDLLHLGGTVQLPNGRSQQVSVEQTSPGHYETTLPDAGPGIYHLRIVASEGGATPADALLSIPYGQEFLPRSPDAFLLSQLATLTGGRVLTDPHQLLGPDQPSATQVHREYWWALVALALALFLADVVLRLSDWGLVLEGETAVADSASRRSERAS